MSQNLLKRAITNKPKVIIFSKCHIFLLKGKFKYFQILAMELRYYDHEVSGISVSRGILISLFYLLVPQFLVTPLEI